MKQKIFALIVFVLVAGTGCEKYLQVDPKGSLGAEELFRNEEGFKQAATGVYSRMAGRSLYGETLTMGFVSVLAQNYNPNLYPAFVFRDAANFNYIHFSSISRTNGIWAGAYSAIADVNSILARIDTQKNIFSGNNYEIVKSEALGLRAYLHFDLLRLFGAIYSKNPTKKAIPYRTIVNGLSQVPATMEEVSALILEDLKMAEALMKNKETITTDKRRRFRMNYYAVRALQARVYLFRGDLENARAAALEVVDSKAFVLTDAASVSAPVDIRDRTFSTEQIFAIRVRDMKTWVQEGSNYFNPLSTSVNTFLGLLAAQYETLYEKSSTDIRYVSLAANYPAPSDSRRFVATTKYLQTWVATAGKTENDRLDQNVSLIRLSEMYYILAETAVTTDEGLKYLNIVRERRALPLLANGISPAALNDEITKEYQKDFYAEGQLFYYYKRKSFTRMLFLNRDVTEANYTLPIPDAELEYNPNYN